MLLCWFVPLCINFALDKLALIVIVTSCCQYACQ